MKKAYQKPCMEMELYALDASIASNCNNIMNMGPGSSDGSHQMCSDWGGMFPNSRIRPYSAGTSFYEDHVCSCYYTAGGEGYFTS